MKSLRCGDRAESYIA